MNKYDENLPLEELQRKAYANLAWYFSEKYFPSNPSSSIEKAVEKIDKLNENLVKSGESSSKLTTALNRITLYGIIIAGIGVLTAVCSLVFEIIKYSSSK